MRKTGFTLIEVTVALIVLQLAALGALATLTQAVRTRRQAERLESRWHAVDVLADSLRGVETPGDGRALRGLDTLTWSVNTDGDFLVRGRGPGWQDSLMVRRESWHARR